jgi:hypothetical protein
MKFLRALSPIQQGLVGTLWFALVGVLFRFGYGALDPEFHSWGMVAIAPCLGLAGMSKPPAATHSRRS